MIIVSNQHEPLSCLFISVCFICLTVRGGLTALQLLTATIKLSRRVPTAKGGILIGPNFWMSGLAMELGLPAICSKTVFNKLQPINYSTLEDVVLSGRTNLSTKLAIPRDSGFIYLLSWHSSKGPGRSTPDEGN